jgi:hypothetical protein
MSGIEYLIFSILAALTGILFIYLPADAPQRRPSFALAAFQQYRRLLVIVCFSWAALMFLVWIGFI